MALEDVLESLKNFDPEQLNDINNIGSLPVAVKIILWLICFSGALVAGYFMHVTNLQSELSGLRYAPVVTTGNQPGRTVGYFGICFSTIKLATRRVTGQRPTKIPHRSACASCRTALNAGSAIPLRTGLRGSNPGPRYHISHESGMQIIPSQNRILDNASIFPSPGVLHRPVIQRESP